MERSCRKVRIGRPKGLKAVTVGATYWSEQSRAESPRGEAWMRELPPKGTVTRQKDGPFSSMLRRAISVLLLRFALFAEIPRRTICLGVVVGLGILRTVAAPMPCVATLLPSILGHPESPFIRSNTKSHGWRR